MKALCPVLNVRKSANVTAGSGVPAAEEAVMRTIPFVLMTFVALSLSASLSTTAAALIGLELRGLVHRVGGRYERRMVP